MKLLLRLLRSAWYTGWYALTLSVVLAAMALSLLRMSLPTIAEHYSDEVEALIGDVLQRPVTIGSMDADWEGLGPRLILNEVLLLEPDGEGVALSVDSASLGFSPAALFSESRYGLSTISLSGFNLILRRNEDGVIDVAGLAEASAESVASAPDASVPDASADARRGFAAWLFAHGHVEVADASVFWIDKRSKGQVWRFSDVNVALRNRQGHYRLQGRAGLPVELGREVEFVLDLDGDVTRPETWSGRNWLRIAELNYGPLRKALGLPEAPVLGGVVDAELWGRLQQGQPQQLLGSFTARDLYLKQEQKQPLYLESVSTRFRWRRSDGDMHLDLAGFRMKKQDQAWPDADFSVDWRKQDGHMRLVRAHGSYLDVRGALELADYFSVIPEAARSHLREMAPSGVMRNLNMQRGTEQDADFMLETEFSGLSLRPVGNWPGVVGASGQLRTDLEHAVLSLDSQGARLLYPEYMARPLDVDQLEGTVYIRNHQDYIQITTTEMLLRTDDASGYIMTDLYWPRQRPRPWLTIQAGLRQARLAAVLDYLPVYIIPEELRSWWGQAVKKGEAVDARVAYSGWTDEYPHDGGRGGLEVRGEVRGLELHYLEDWPALRGASAQLQLAGGNLYATLGRGRLRQSGVAGARIQVLGVNSDDPRVRIRGSISGATSAKAAFIQATPDLARIFSDIDRFDFTGQSQLDLDVMVPIKHPGDVQVRGKMSVTDNSIAWRGDLGEIATGVSTAVSFVDDNVSVEDGSGKLFRQPVRLAARTVEQQSGRRVIELVAKGDYRLDSLLTRFGAENWSHVADGEDKFLAILQVPLGDSANAYPVVNLSASLKEIESSLPSPLDKKAGQDRTLNLRLVFKPNVHEWYVDDGRRLRAAVAMLPLEEGYEVSHGEVLAGRGRPDLAWKSGLRLRGDLQRFSMDEWMKVIEGARGPSQSGHETGWDPLPAWVQRVELNVGSMQIFERDYNMVRLRADKHQAGLMVAVNSSELIGDINLPASPDVPVKLRLQYWNLVSMEEELPSYSRPTELPSMNIECDDFRYNGGALGRLSVVVSPVDEGLRVEKLEIHSAHTNLVGVLDWTWRDGTHYSSIDLSIESQNVGKTMSGLGYAGTVKGGSGVLSMKANWQAPPPEFLTEHLNGEIHMQLKNGRLLEIDPGAGRALAIFSLQMLPQRLLLDFSDLFSEGFEFDSIGGDFTIQEGDAYTANLLMEGPASKILIAGRTGLASRDYDQLVTVIPEVTASIPVLTWWLVDLPAGVLALALQKLFQTEIDDVVKFQYIISGSWSDPVITKVEPEQGSEGTALPEAGASEG